MLANTVPNDFDSVERNTGLLYCKVVTEPRHWSCSMLRWKLGGQDMLDGRSGELKIDCLSYKLPCWDMIKVRKCLALVSFKRIWWRRIWGRTGRHGDIYIRSGLLGYAACYQKAWVEHMYTDSRRSISSPYHSVIVLTLRSNYLGVY